MIQYNFLYVQINFFTDSVSKDQFSLLCPDGSRKPIDDHLNCNWGEIPSNAVVVSSATETEKRNLYQSFLEKAAKILGKYQNDTNFNNNNEFYNNRFDNRQGKGFESDQDSEYNQYNKNYENRNNNNENDWNSSTGFYDRSRTQFSTQEPNIQSIDKFNLFDSAPRYGFSRNLLFSVSSKSTSN